MKPISKRRQSTLSAMIHGALLGDCAWQDVVSDLGDLLPDARVTLFVHDGRAGTGQFVLTSGFSADEVRAYDTTFAAINPWMRGAARRPVGLGVEAEAMLAREALVRTEFYDGFLRPMGCEGAIGMTIERSADRLCLLSVLTSQVDRAANAEAAGVLTGIAPDLRKALRLKEGMAGMLARADAVEAAAEGFGIGVAVIGAELRPLRLSDTARVMLEIDAGLWLTRSGRLHIADDGCLSALRGMLTWPPAGPSRYVGRVMAADGRTTRISMVRIDSPGPIPSLDGPGVVLMFERERRPDIPASEVLAQRFGLTRAEAETLTALCGGASVSQIATRRGISNATVRSQIKVLFDKTGTARQVDLIRLVIG